MNIEIMEQEEKRVELFNAEQTTTTALHAMFSRPDGVHGLIEHIRMHAFEAAKGIAADDETGRKALKKIARDVASVKTRLDETGKEFTEYLAKTKAIYDNNRKKIRDELDKIRDEIKAPAVAYDEAQEALKIEAIQHLNEIKAMTIVNDDGLLKPSTEIQAMIDRLDVISNMKFQYYQSYVDVEAASKLALLETGLLTSSAHEQQQREIAEQQAKIEAAEKELREKQLKAEAKAEAEREALLREEAMKRELEEAQQRAAEAEAKAAAEFAKKQTAEAEAKAAAEADAENQKRVNNAVLSKLQALGVTKPVAIAVIDAIINGEIPNLSIDYTK